MSTTLKVHTTGRFGARYGVSVKKRVLKVERKQKAKHICPYCGFAKIKRKSRGIFFCKKCDAVFAGGAFLPFTLSGGIVKKMVSQKSFLPLVSELVAIQEKESLEAVSEEEPEKALEEGHEKAKRKHKEDEEDV